MLLLDYASNRLSNKDHISIVGIAREYNESIIGKGCRLEMQKGCP